MEKDLMKIYYFKKIQNYHFEKYYKIFSIISLKHAIHKYKHKRKKKILNPMALGIILLIW